MVVLVALEKKLINSDFTYLLLYVKAYLIMSKVSGESLIPLGIR